MAHMSAPDTPPGMFSEPPEDKHFPTTAVSIAAVAVAILVTVLVLIARRPAVVPPTVNAAYGPNLELSGIQMSEADSQTGGRLIYIDGRVTNHGTATVTGVRVQVTFPDDLSQPPQVETVPMNLIYMRDPYVDTRPIAASPIAAGQAVDFRLIFDDINENWNQQQPDFKIAQVTTK
jgi:hypothetical protein